MSNKITPIELMTETTVKNRLTLKQLKAIQS